MPINISELSISKVRGYRKFAFSVAVTKPDHDPFFSLEDYELWASSQGLLLYNTWLENVAQDAGGLDEGSSGVPAVEELLERASIGDLKGFREMITAPLYSGHKYFSIDNAHEWVRPIAFDAYLLWFRALYPSSRATTPSSGLGISRPSSVMSNTSSLDFAACRMDPEDQHDGFRKLCQVSESSKASVHSASAGDNSDPIYVDSDDEMDVKCEPMAERVPSKAKHEPDDEPEIVAESMKDGYEMQFEKKIPRNVKKDLSGMVLSTITTTKSQS